MAGRGCTVKIQILRQDEGHEVFTDEISLPVALHSPLSVLKNLLQDVAHIAVTNQVLILCDLSDPDRNNDTHLDSSKDEQTLFQCGVQQGSVLALHALGSNTADISHFADLHKNRKVATSSTDPRPIQTLITAVTPAQANHSYNGILFDMVSKSPFEVDITSIGVGGMLGRVRVYFKYGTWLDTESTESMNAQRWWGASERVSSEGWSVVADSICTPSWDNAHEVVFRKPINMLPGQRIALYLHSGLPDDLGIQYQTYSRDAIVAEDDHIILFPGLGHTGSEPFDELHGWYRAYRGLAGSMRYRCHRKGWTIWSHVKFPQHFRDSVLTVLLCQEHSLNLLYRNRRFLLNAYAASNQLLLDADNTGAEAVDRTRQLGLLHTHILYYIMEFMHWDWFPAPETMDAADEAAPALDSRAAQAALRHLVLRAAASGLDLSSEAVQEGISQMYASLMQQLHGGAPLGIEDEGDYYEEDDDDSNVYEDESSDGEGGEVESSASGSSMVTGSEGNAELMSEDSDDGEDN